jgi:drug/metabolite transporter (DMT)-like permease
MKKLASGMVILAGILWGSMGIFVRKFKECGLGSLDIVAIRAITTMCILFLFLLFYNRSLLRIKLRDLWCFLGTGLLSIVFFNYCYFRAITMTSLSVAAIGVIPLCNFEKVIKVSCASINMIGWSLLFVFFSTVLAFCLYTAGLKNLNNGKASILASVEPVAATLIGVILYKETLSAGEIFGVILVMVAIVMCNLTNKDKK